MTNNKREVKRHEVRAICAAGGEVTDGDGDVYFVYTNPHVAVFVKRYRDECRFATADAHIEHARAPFTVTKEPPAKSEIADMFAKLDASLTRATESPWRRGVPEKSGTYWWRNASDSGLCHVRIPAWSPDDATALRVGSTVPFDNAGWFESTEFAPLRERAPE